MSVYACVCVCVMHEFFLLCLYLPYFGFCPMNWAEAAILHGCCLILLISPWDCPYLPKLYSSQPGFYHYNQGQEVEEYMVEESPP